MFQKISLFIFFLPLLSTLLSLHVLNNYRIFNKSKRLGGTIITIIIEISLIVYYIFFPNYLLAKDFWSLLIGITILFIGGLWDDIKNLNWKKQLLFQSLAIIPILAAGDTIDHIKLPGESTFWIPVFFTYLLSFIWSLLVINSLNWFDGSDGLAGTVGLITLLILATLSINLPVNQPATFLLCLLISGSVMGFLFFNFSPAYFHLGTTGIWVLGFLIAVISIYSGGKVATASLVLGIPIINFIYVSLARLIEGKLPTVGKDRLHFHEKLIDSGWKCWQINIIFGVISVLLGVGALLSQTQGKIFLLMILTGFLLYFLFFFEKHSSQNSTAKKQENSLRQGQ